MIQGKNDQERWRKKKKKRIMMAMNHPNGHFPASLSILKVDNYENYCKQVTVVFCFQDLWDLVKKWLEWFKEDTL